MSSKSGNDGSYSLTVTFDIGTDKNIDAVEVQNRVAIAQSQLPADVHPQRHHGAQVDHRLPRGDRAHVAGAPLRRRVPEQLCVAQSV